MRLDTDVLIVGGGPAGASAALSLLTYSDTRVTLVEQSALDRLRPGEHVSAGLFDLISYLQLDRNDFEPGSFLPVYGSTSYWGSDLPLNRDTIFAGQEATCQLDREKFDSLLLRKVAERGGNVFPRTKCVNYRLIPGGHWEILLQHEEKGKIRLNARFLVDATGRQGNVCRQIGVPGEKLDALMGAGAFLDIGDREATGPGLVLEAVEQGWWYSNVLPGNVLAVIFFSDADIVSGLKLNRKEGWNRLLEQTKQVKRRTRHTSCDQAHPWVRHAHTQISGFSRQKHFLAIGDAASSFDPISSMGIGFAISSACSAAGVIREALNKENSGAIAVFEQDIRRHFRQYLKFRQIHYQQEKRWAAADFWARRR